MVSSSTDEELRKYDRGRNWVATTRAWFFPRGSRPYASAGSILVRNSDSSSADSAGFVKLDYQPTLLYVANYSESSSRSQFEPT